MSQSFDKKRKTWSARYVYRDPITNKKRSRKKRGFATKREALKWEMEQKEGQKLSTSATFEEMALKWLDNNQASKESRRKAKQNLEFRCQSFKVKPMDRITRKDLAEWRLWLVGSGFSTNTKNQCISFVRGVYGFASAFYGIDNIAILLKRAKKSNEEVLHEMQVWSPDEFKKFRDAVSDYPIYQIYFDVLYWTGMRRGEAIALQCSDLSDDGWINIHHSQRSATEGLKPTKTKQSRKVHLVGWLNDELQPLRQVGGYLFGGDDSLAPTTIDHIFKLGIKNSGVKKIRLHDLRHSFATNAINNGVNIVAVSKYLGHSTIEQTIKTYTHLLKESDDALLDVMNSLKK